MNLEYVASGLGHTRMLQQSIINGPASTAIDGMIKSMQGKHGHDYSCLFNAHTEKQFGPQINKAYNNWYKIHSDSGGLQIITQGLKIDSKMKTDVYDVQSKWSDLAMSFDEIPIVLTGERSGRNDVDNRFFDDKNFKDYAVRTGHNITEQINFILDNGRTRCKPLLIVQGNCVDTYKQWVDVMLETIPENLHQHIGGISLGAAGLGTGALEDIERMFAFTQIEAPDHIKSNLHVLGIGSVRRLLPCMMFKEAGLMDGVHVSYDSTTHTSGVTMGHYYSHKMKRIRKFPINYSSFAKEILDDIKGYFDMDVDPQMFIDSIKMNNKRFADLYPTETERDYRLQVIFGFVGASILNFTKYVDEIMQNPYTMSEFVQKEGIPGILHLQNVTDHASWIKWKNAFGKRMKSARVKRLSDVQSQNTLFEF